MVVLITGIAGFAGSHIAERVLATTDWDIVGVDRYTYAGKLGNLSHLDTSRIHMMYHDFSQPFPERLPLGPIDYIIHNGAETHVRNSLLDPIPFMSANILGTFHTLNFALSLRTQLKKFLYVSTDEVFGPSLVGHKEDEALAPSNPYSASKAAGEYLVRAWATTYMLPYLITRSTNLYGSRQHPEKFIPMVKEQIAKGETITIHTDAQTELGSRCWLHVRDQADALIFLLQQPAINQTFHIAGERKTNYEIVRSLMTAAPNFKSPIQFKNAYTEFPGHDLHYALDDSKIRALGWSPKVKFEDGICAI